MTTPDYPTVYLTVEQIHRMSGLACDAMVGIQFNTNDHDTTTVNGCFVRIDRPQDLEFFEIDPDGTLRVTT